MALSVLTEWAARAAKGPAPPDISVRLALALLYTCGKSRDRRNYDELWKRLSDPGLANATVEQRNYMRGSYCDSCIKGIIADVGAPQTPDFWARLSEAARTKREPTDY